MRIIISSVPMVISPPSLTRQESNFAIRRCQSRIEFWVEIYRGEKEGGLKTSNSRSAKPRSNSLSCQSPESSRPGEFHPQSLTEPDLTLSRRPALLRLAAAIPRFIASVPPIAG
jgi:hypothetical protein